MSPKESDSLRFVAWNTSKWNQSDAAQLRELDCDLAVLCEAGASAPATTLDTANPAIAWHWKGLNDKGLVLAGFGHEVTPLAERDNPGRYSMAATTSLGFGLLGIWSCPAKGSREPYGHQVHRAVHAHADWLADHPSIIAGDFNVSPNGIEGTRSGVLQKIWADLDELGYVSLYHHHTGEAYGNETTPTYFHYWHEDKGFHIDYCFIHRDLLPRVTGFHVGTYREYVRGENGISRLSDHVPLVVDLAKG